MKTINSRGVGCENVFMLCNGLLGRDGRDTVK